jgi:hypothetical protein
MKMEPSNARPHDAYREIIDALYSRASDLEPGTSARCKIAIACMLLPLPVYSAGLSIVCMIAPQLKAAPIGKTLPITLLLGCVIVPALAAIVSTVVQTVAWGKRFVTDHSVARREDCLFIQRMASKFEVSDLTTAFHATELRNSMFAESSRELLGPLARIPMLVLGIVCVFALTMPDRPVQSPEGFTWLSHLLPSAAMTLNTLGIAALLLFINRALTYGTRYRYARYVALVKAAIALKACPATVVSGAREGHYVGYGNTSHG